MDHPHDAGHLVVAEFLGRVALGVVVGVQPGVHEDRGDPAVQEGPLVAAPQQVRGVVVVAEPHVEPRRAVGPLDRPPQVRRAAVAEDVDGVAVLLGRLRREAPEPEAADLGDLFVAADHVHVHDRHGLRERVQGRLGVGPRAQQALLFRVPRREQDGAAGPVALARRRLVRLGDLDQRRHPRRVVVGPVVDDRSPRAVVVVVGADDDPLVAQVGVGALDQPHHVAVRHRRPPHRGRHLDARPRQRDRRDPAGPLGRLRQVAERPARRFRDALREVARDVDDGHVHRPDPAREPVARDAGRPRRPHRVHRPGRSPRAPAVVAGAHQHRGRAAGLGGEDLADQPRLFGADRAVERAVRVELARLVFEHQGDGPVEIRPAVVVVAERRGVDAEPDEHHVPGRPRGGADGVGIERPPEGGVRPSDAADAQGVVGAEGGGEQVEPVEVGAVGPRWREAVPGEARGDEVGRDPVLGRVRQPAAQAVGGEEPDVGLEVAGPDRPAARRRGRGRILRHDRRRHQDRRRRRRRPAGLHHPPIVPPPRDVRCIVRRVGRKRRAGLIGMRFMCILRMYTHDYWVRRQRWPEYSC